MKLGLIEREEPGLASSYFKNYNSQPHLLVLFAPTYKYKIIENIKNFKTLHAKI